MEVIDRRRLNHQVLIRQMPDAAAARAAVARLEAEWMAGGETWLARRQIEWIAFLEPAAAQSFVEWLRADSGGRAGETWHFTGKERVSKAEFVDRLGKQAQVWARARYLGTGPPGALDRLDQRVASLPEDSEVRPTLAAIAVLTRALSSPVTAARRLANDSPALEAPGARWIVDEVAWRLWLIDPDRALAWLDRMAQSGVAVSGVTVLAIMDSILRDPTAAAPGRVTQLSEHAWRGGQGWALLEVERILEALPACSPAGQVELLAVAAGILDRVRATSATTRWIGELRSRVSALLPIVGTDG